MTEDDKNEESKPITLDDFTGLLIHSYNNHLSSMMGYAELALLECNDQKVGERLNKSLESGISAVHFGKSILASIGRLQVSRIEVNFNQWLKELIQSIQVDFEDNDLVVENDVDDGVTIKTDFSWFTECCVDLIRFLLAFDPEASLTFRSEVESIEVVNIENSQLKPFHKKRVVICINSEQVELEGDQQEWLFTPFYSSRLLLGDKDIGLAKAKGFFEQMGATLTWDNDSGFTIEIPSN